MYFSRSTTVSTACTSSNRWSVAKTGATRTRGQDWGYSDRFPRVTLCEFEIRHQSRVHNYIVQCALTINLFNEKIFIFVWFWFVLVAVVTTVNFMRWLFRALYWPQHVPLLLLLLLLLLLQEQLVLLLQQLLLLARTRTVRAETDSSDGRDATWGWNARKVHRELYLKDTLYIYYLSIRATL